MKLGKIEKERFANVSKAIRAYKEVRNKEVYTCNEYDKQKKEEAHASWEIFHAALDLAQQAIINIELSDGMTEERAAKYLAVLREARFPFQITK